jgi:hypothetical protein
MRKLQKVALVAAMAGAAGFIGAGTAAADGKPGVDIKQSVACRGHDTNLSVLDISALNGAILAGAIGNDGGVGNTDGREGSVHTCTASALS